MWDSISHLTAPGEAKPNPERQASGFQKTTA